MFFDPQCKPQVKANPFDFKQFVGWLETQPADKTYEWGGRCLIEQYMEHLGLPEYSCYTTEGPDGHNIYFHLTPGALAAFEPHTFGAALERARAML